MKYFKINEKEILKINNGVCTKVQFQITPFKISEEEINNIDFPQLEELSFDECIDSLKNGIYETIDKLINNYESKIMKNNELIDNFGNIKLDYLKYFLLDFSKNNPIFVVLKDEKYEIIEIKDDLTIEEIDFNMNEKSKLKEINFDEFKMRIIQNKEKYYKKNNIMYYDKILELKKLILEIQNLDISFVMGE